VKYLFSTALIFLGLIASSYADGLLGKTLRGTYVNTICSSKCSSGPVIKFHWYISTQGRLFEYTTGKLILDQGTKQNGAVRTVRGDTIFLDTGTVTYAFSASGSSCAVTVVKYPPRYTSFTVSNVTCSVTDGPPG